MNIKWESFKERKRIDCLTWGRKLRIKNYDDLFIFLKSINVDPPPPTHPDVADLLYKRTESIEQKIKKHKLSIERAQSHGLRNASPDTLIISDDSIGGTNNNKVSKPLDKKTQRPKKVSQKKKKKKL